MTDDHFQTYLDETFRADLVEAENERAVIYRHIGEYVSTWAHAEFRLALASSTWANPHGPAGLQRFFSDQSASRKIDALNLLFPKEWRDGQTLIRHLREANVYRNNIAHWTLAMGGWDGERQLGWHFAEMWKHRAIEIDLDALGDQTLTVRALQDAVLLTAGEPYFGAEGQAELETLNATSLAQLMVAMPGTWESRAQRARYTAAIGKLFP